MKRETEHPFARPTFATLGSRARRTTRLAERMYAFLNQRELDRARSRERRLRFSA